MDACGEMTWKNTGVQSYHYWGREETPKKICLFSISLPPKKFEKRITYRLQEKYSYYLVTPSRIKVSGTTLAFDG